MKKVWLVSYWVLTIVLLALMLVSFDYSFGESIFLASAFLPGAIAVKFLLPKISFADKKNGIRNLIFVIIGIIVIEFILLIDAHLYISLSRQESPTYGEILECPEMLINPIFIAIVMAALACGNYYTEKWLDKKYPKKRKPITFLSDRRPVTLEIDNILYVESNDSITTVHSCEGQSFRNITPISQWEAILEPDFIRIHRSFLVNRVAITNIVSDAVFVGEMELPVSRKYKDNLRRLNIC